MSEGHRVNEFQHPFKLVARPLPVHFLADILKNHPLHLFAAQRNFFLQPGRNRFVRWPHFIQTLGAFLLEFTAEVAQPGPWLADILASLGRLGSGKFLRSEPTTIFASSSFGRGEKKQQPTNPNVA